MPNAAVQADWVEASCLFGRDSSISHALIESALAESGSEKSELIVEDIWGELESRKSILPNYPFNIQDTLIQRISRWEDSPHYSFMLLLAINFFYESTKIRQNNQRVPSKLFERLVSIALKKYMRQSINIGSPREGRISRSLKQSLKFFCGLCNESMQEKPEITHYAKDEGVDVIAWDPIDCRSGQVILLVQCTIERDWTRSCDKINLDTWKHIVNFATTPEKAVAFPYVCNEQWKNWSTRGGILFDRLRLVSMLSSMSTIYLRRKILEWSNAQVTNLKWFE